MIPDTKPTIATSRAAKREPRVIAHAAVTPAAHAIFPVPAEPIVDEGIFHGETVEVIERMRAGTPAGVIADFAGHLGITPEALFTTLRLPTRALKSRIKKNSLLTDVEQDRIYRLDRVWWRALDVFDGESSACHWVRGRVRSIGGVSPLSLLDTPVGYELVLRTLSQIEYGIVS